MLRGNVFDLECGERDAVFHEGGFEGLDRGVLVGLERGSVPSGASGETTVIQRW